MAIQECHWYQLPRGCSGDLKNLAQTSDSFLIILARRFIFQFIKMGLFHLWHRSRVVILKTGKSQWITCLWSILPINLVKMQLLQISVDLCREKAEIFNNTSCSCSVILNFLDKMASSRWEATESKLCIHVHIIRFSITPIRNHSIIVIKYDSNLLIIFYFIQQLCHSSKLKNFSEFF